MASARVHATIYVLNAEGTHDRREFETISDEEGRYRLTLPKGRNRIVASADGYAPISLGLEIYGDQTKDLTLEPSANISGRVVTGAERTPVAGAEVKLRRENGYDTTGRLLTDERGAFTSNALSPGTYRLEARKDGLLGRFAKAIVLSATDRIDGIEIVVSATFAVRGRVTAPSGSAIAVAVVNLETDESMGFGALPARVVTDDEGRYVIDGFLPREYQLQI
ncbi:MAG TPA: carboxypeptidase regulatory-like domain-containing protein, partial [Polyangia bacterium]